MPTRGPHPADALHPVGHNGGGSRMIERALPTADGAGVDLAALRRARGAKQEAVARRLAIGQGGVSRIERQADLHVSTLRRYVRALGGTLKLVAVFPDATIPIGGRAELAADPPQPASTQPAGGSGVALRS